MASLSKRKSSGKTLSFYLKVFYYLAYSWFVLPCLSFDPIPAYGLNWYHISHFYSMNLSCHLHILNRRASVVSPNNFWEIWVTQHGFTLKSFFSSFCLSGDVCYPQSYWRAELVSAAATAARGLHGTTALPTSSWYSSSWKTFHVVKHVAFISCLKGLTHIVFCILVEENVLLLRLRHRL